jgi:uncharacterized membrane protein YdbT with pleckstrin-like domain
MEQLEKQVIKSRVHWSNLIAPSLWALVWAGILLNHPVLYLIIGCVPLAKQWLENKFTYYTLTDLSLIIETGWIISSKKEIPLMKINDLELSQNIIQKIYGAGTIIIMTGNDLQIVLKNIENSKLFKDQLSLSMNKTTNL